MERTWKPTTAGVLNIISGVCGIGAGTLLIMLAIGFSELILSAIDIEMIVGAFEITTNLVMAVGIMVVVFGIIALVGGVYSIKRRKWGLALAGSILALFTGGLLGLLSVIFVSLGRREFE